jgi:hypothetical protein
MNAIFNDVVVNEKPTRITRIVSVILNGVVLNKLAVNNDNNVDAMADNLISNLSDVMQRNILTHEIPLVETSLRSEIQRRIDLPQAV